MSSINSNICKSELDELISTIFDIQEKIDNGTYLRLMNLTKSVFDKTNNLPEIHYHYSDSVIREQVVRLKNTISSLESDNQRLTGVIRTLNGENNTLYDMLDQRSIELYHLENELKNLKSKPSSLNVSSKKVKCNICLREVNKNYLKTHQKKAVCKNNAI